jgi:hypothetical protein
MLVGFVLFYLSNFLSYYPSKSVDLLVWRDLTFIALIFQSLPILEEHLYFLLKLNLVFLQLENFNLVAIGASLLLFV